MGVCVSVYAGSGSTSGVHASVCVCECVGVPVVPYSVHVSGYQVSRCVSACVSESNLFEHKLHLWAISHFVLVVAAVSYLSASEDFSY